MQSVTTTSGIWLEDRQYRWLIPALMIMTYSWAILPDTLIYIPVPDGAPEPTPLLSFRAKFLPLMALAAWILARRSRLLLTFISDLNPFLPVLLTWFMVTSLWAPAPTAAFTQLLSLVGLTVIAIAATLASWRKGRFEAVLLPTHTIMLLASLIFVVFIPELGIHHENQFELLGAWRGITYGKNALGPIAATGLIFWLHAWGTRRIVGMKALFGVGLCIVMLIGVRSSTAFLLSLITALVLVLRLRPPLRLGSLGISINLLIALSIVTPVFIYLVIVGSLAWTDIATPLSGIFGKDASFSGRTYIWAEVARSISDHPVLGVGFNSFWGPPNSGAPSDEAIRRLKWPCPNAHNGYLDIFNDNGVIGFALLLGYIAAHGAALKRLKAVDRQQHALHEAIFIYTILENLIESGWFRPIAQTQVIIMFSSAEIARLLFQHRLQAQLQAPKASASPHLARSLGPAST